MWIVLLAGLMLLPALGRTRTREPLAYTSTIGKTLTDSLTTLLAEEKTPSVSVSVVNGGQVVYQRALGTARYDDRSAARVETRYHVGSITKMFTAVAIMQQVEHHRIVLDQPVARYLPTAPHARQITVRQLLMHRSGLADYLDAAVSDGAVAKPTTPSAIIQSMAAKPLLLKPGTAYEYSNFNYVLLGQIVEKVAHKPLSRYLQRYVFDPARMKDTTVGTVPPGAPTAVGYGEPGTAAVPPVQSPGDMSWYYACGDIISTADDIARFDVALMSGRILKPSSFRAMWSGALPTEDAARSLYGLGVQVLSLADGRVLVGHHGGEPGFEADNEMIVSDRFAMAVFGNDYAFQTGPVLHLVLSTFYPVATRQAELKEGVPPPDAYPAVTARVKIILQHLMAGNLQEISMTDAMTNALTPDKVAALSAQIDAFGTLKTVTYLGLQRYGTNVKYQYRVAFTKKTVMLFFDFDANNRLAGFFFGD